jgi:hypothetical protein
MEVVSLLHPGVREGIEDFERQFKGAQPFRHVVVEQFLDPRFCQELIAEFPAFDTRLAKNERGELGRKAVNARIARLGPAYARFDGLMRDREFLSLLSRITGIAGLLYDPEYVGGGTHENLDGQELDPHVDFNYHPHKPLHRRLNLIVFLNPEWEGAWGGCLELLREPWAESGEQRATVLPLANRAVIFETTESSWHGFLRIRTPPGREISRKSIAVYFYTKHRPAQETAPSHGTLYYQRPLPSYIQAGCTLREEDAAEIRTLLARRDSHMRFLYERELEFSELIAGITRSPTFRLARALTWPARLLRSLARKTRNE